MLAVVAPLPVVVSQPAASTTLEGQRAAVAVVRMPCRIVGISQSPQPAADGAVCTSERTDNSISPVSSESFIPLYKWPHPPGTFLRGGD